MAAQGMLATTWACRADGWALSPRREVYLKRSMRPLCLNHNIKCGGESVLPRVTLLVVNDGLHGEQDTPDWVHAISSSAMNLGCSEIWQILGASPSAQDLLTRAPGPLRDLQHNRWPARFHWSMLPTHAVQGTDTRSYCQIIGDSGSFLLYTVQCPS